MGQREAESISEQHYLTDKRKAEKMHEKMKADALINHKKAIAQQNTAMRVQKMVKRNQCLEDLKILAINKLQSGYDSGTPQY